MKACGKTRQWPIWGGFAPGFRKQSKRSACAAGVYFPLHVLLASDGVRTHVSTVKPSGVFDARLPAGAAEPIDRLEARVAREIESLVGGAT